MDTKILEFPQRDSNMPNANANLSYRLIIQCVTHRFCPQLHQKSPFTVLSGETCISEQTRTSCSRLHTTIILIHIDESEAGETEEGGRLSG